MIQAHAADGTNLQYAEVTAVIRRADGTIERHVLDSYESPTHRAKREAAGLELPAPTFTMPPPKPSKLRGLLKLIGLGVLAACVTRAACEYPSAVAVPLMLGATVIVNGGQAINTNLVSGLGGTVPKYVAWGTGAGTAAITDTTLFTESTDEARTNGTPTRVTTTVTNDTYQVVGTITVAVTGKTITNVGLFDASTTGNLYFKSDFTGLALAVADSITFTIKNKFA